MTAEKIYILNIETATKNCSVSVSENGVTLLCREMAEQGYSHAEKLHVFIEEVVKESNITLKDLSRSWVVHWIKNWCFYCKRIVLRFRDSTYCC